MPVMRVTANNMITLEQYRFGLELLTRVRMMAWSCWQVSVTSRWEQIEYQGFTSQVNP